MVLKALQFEGRVEDPLDPHKGKRKVKTKGYPECISCGVDIVEEDIFYMAYPSKKIFCQNCEDVVDRQLMKDQRKTENEVSRYAPIYLEEVVDQNEG